MDFSGFETQVRGAWTDRNSVADVVSNHLRRHHDNLGAHDSDDQVRMALRVGVLVGLADSPHDLGVRLEALIQEYE